MSRDDNTPAVMRAVKNKINKYDLICRVCDIQTTVKRTGRPIELVPAIVTHRGEMSTELLDLIEQCTSKVKFARNVFDMLGRSNAQRATYFRREFKDSIICAIAKGWGFTLGLGIAKNNNIFIAGVID